jgi:Protein-L-isoaspartate(D-aspartate) O-methyltransferase (PCMT)
MAPRVYTIEHHPRLAKAARRRLKRLGYDNVEVCCGDDMLDGFPPPNRSVARSARVALLEPALISRAGTLPIGRRCLPITTKPTAAVRTSDVLTGPEAQFRAPFSLNGF